MTLALRKGSFAPVAVPRVEPTPAPAPRAWSIESASILPRLSAAELAMLGPMPLPTQVAARQRVARAMIVESERAGVRKTRKAKV